MLEWLKRHAWKACNRLKRFVGSNPILSAGWASGLSWNARSICFYKNIHLPFIRCFNGGAIIPPMEVQSYLQWKYNHTSNGSTIIPPMEVQSYLQWKCNRTPNGKAIVFPLGRQSCSHWEGNRVPIGKAIVFPIGRQLPWYKEALSLHIRKGPVFL